MRCDNVGDEVSQQSMLIHLDSTLSGWASTRAGGRGPPPPRDRRSRGGGGVRWRGCRTHEGRSVTEPCCASVAMRRCAPSQRCTPRPHEARAGGGDAGGRLLKARHRALQRWRSTKPLVRAYLGIQRRSGGQPYALSTSSLHPFLLRPYPYRVSPERERT